MDPLRSRYNCRGSVIALIDLVLIFFVSLLFHRSVYGCISPARFRRLSFSSFVLVYSCFLRTTSLTRFPSRYTFDEVTSVHYPRRSFIAVIYDYYYCTVMATAVAWRPHIEKLFLLQRKRVEHCVTTESCNLSRAFPRGNLQFGQIAPLHTARRPRFNYFRWFPCVYLFSV